ncbi:hypothetical protein SAMN04488693_1032 [Arthrobacter subterraneus]|uniref:Uncharacterized protein n=1 Tax=Arthrobacter subterraneus TaxID=335973 RepID=A0A1G8FC77_9MICC|nr:hypothetical protein SAMN04488693_1032 [Arthrobacter subterraneus]
MAGSGAGRDDPRGGVGDAIIRAYGPDTFGSILYEGYKQSLNGEQDPPASEEGRRVLWIRTGLRVTTRIAGGARVDIEQ